jgi:hypothetical protein
MNIYAFGHGTHNMGIVCGGAPGLPVGVAPGAQWITAGVIDRTSSINQTVSNAILAFQWIIDPDGDPDTTWDVPHVCSNSWRLLTSHGYPPCDETFWSYLDACEAAGIVILFSAGNEGPGPNTLGRPPDRATDDYRTLAVGGVNANAPGYPIASWSSRGPSYCTPTGDPAIKPELVGPAIEVISSMPGSGYEYWNGTSFASPHVNGVVALVLEACPDLSVQEVKQILYDTALDLGPVGKDNTYSYGLVDAYEAVNLAIQSCSPAPYAFDADYETPVNAPLPVTLEAIDYDGLPDPPGAVTYIITSPPEPGNTLTDVGNNHVIDAGELPYALVNGGNQVMYTPTGDYYGTDTFAFRGNDGGEPPDGGDGNIAAISVLVLFDPPVITTDLLPSGTTDAPYGPVTLEAAGGQPELAWEAWQAGEYFETDLGSCLFEGVGEPQNWRQIDEAWAYTLPFIFPFYGVEHNYFHGVCNNGFIDIYDDLHYWGNNDDHLIAHTYIAPLWDHLRTDWDHDIYIDESVPGQVTIRWDAYTFWGGGGQCDFSVQLFEDGRIRFHYGPSNQAWLTPTVGISAGDGSNYVLSRYNNVRCLSSVNSLEFAPRPVQLPEGLEVSPDGVLSGFTTQYGTFHPTFVVTDALGRSDERELELVIEPGLGPPIAEDQEVSTLANRPIAVSLVAVDDGTPDPPGTLTYVIDSLPEHGALSDPAGGLVDSVPYTLVNGGHDVVYTPDWWYFGQDSFTFKANDGGSPPDGGDSNVATVSADVTLPDPWLAYSFPLNNDPGWATEGQWAFGQPTGGGSQNHDPLGGHTGDNVYGYNLAGDYTNDMPAYYLTTSPIDCSHLIETELRFWRWLGVESSVYDHAGIEVSTDGAGWTEIWSNPDHLTADEAWTQMAFDISEMVDGQPTLYVRWAMGPTDDFVTCPGWNIDDVEIWAVVTTAAPGDLTGDGCVDLTDLGIMLSTYGRCPGDEGYNPVANLVENEPPDGCVGLPDLALLLAHYGEGCP